MEGAKASTNALRKLHAALARELRANRTDAKRLRESLGHIEQTLKLLDPHIKRQSLAAARREYPHKRLGHGEPSRIAFDVLRTATNPMACREIAEMVYRSRGIAADKTNITTLSHALRRALEVQRGKTVTGDGLNPERWSIIRDGAG